MNIYLVGGAVRDGLLGRPVSERDWVVVGGSATTLLDQGYQQVGKDFPVFLHPETREEYALARTERKTGPGHKGFQFHADATVTLEEDLSRRDLTVNAMARSQDGQLVDPYRGQADLEQRLLRHVSEAFREDPLRVFRVARFAAQLPEFRVADETQQLMRTMARSGELSELSAERVWAELSKALGGLAPDRFVGVLKACDALFPWLGEFQAIEPQVPIQLRNTDQQFAAYVSGLTHQQVDELSRRLKVPASHQTLAGWIVDHSGTVAGWRDQDPEQLYLALTQCRAFKPESKLAHNLLVVEQLQAIDLGPLMDVVQRIVREITAAPLQAQGLAGAKLGRALDEARIDAIKIAQRSPRVGR